MKNKILIKLIVPVLMEEYEIFIPVNERVFKVKELIVNSLYDLSDNKFDNTKKYNLIDPETGEVYDGNNIIRELNVYNSKRLLLY